MKLLTLIPLLLASYGLCFGFMNDKASWITGPLRKIRFRVRQEGDEDEPVETTFFDRMLRCPYCTGFHTGWMSWLASVAVVGWWVPLGKTTEELILGVLGNVVCLGLFAFASSAFCYLVDTGAQWLER